MGADWARREAGDKKAIAGPEEVQPSWLAPSPSLTQYPTHSSMSVLLVRFQRQGSKTLRDGERATGNINNEPRFSQAPLAQRQQRGERELLGPQPSSAPHSRNSHLHTTTLLVDSIIHSSFPYPQ